MHIIVDLANTRKLLASIEEKIESYKDKRSEQYPYDRVPPPPRLLRERDTLRRQLGLSGDDSQFAPR